MFVKKLMFKFLSNQKAHQLFPWICAKVKNSGIFIIYSVYLTILQSFNLLRYERNIFSYNCLTLLWPWNMVMVTESGITVLLCTDVHLWHTKWLPYTPNLQPVYHWDAQDLSCTHSDLISLKRIKTLVGASQ